MQVSEFYLCDSFFSDTFFPDKDNRFRLFKIMFALFIHGLYPKFFES